MIYKLNEFIKSSNGNLHRKMITRAFKLLVEWKESSFYWVPLKYIKQSNPVELDEYSMANDISDETDFSWWVKETFFHQDMIIYKLKSNYWRTSHKLLVLVPKTLTESYDIDRQSGTEFWTKVIAK